MNSNECLGYPSFPIEQDVVLLDIEVLENNEVIHNVPYPKMEVKSQAPLMSFGWDYGLDEIEPSHASRLQYFPYCLDQKGDYFSQFQDTPTYDQTIVDEIIEYENLHPIEDAGVMPPSSTLEENVSHKGTNHSLQDSLLPPFSFKEGDLIIGAPSLKIIVETLCHETMVMLGPPNDSFIVSSSTLSIIGGES